MPVYNLSRTALMTASLFSGSLNNLRVAVQDRLHQPYRLPMIPGAEQVFTPHTTWAPTAVASAGPGPPFWPSLTGRRGISAGARLNQLEQAGLSGWRVLLLGCDTQGARVQFDSQPPAVV